VVPEFAFDLDVSALLQSAGPFTELVPADNAMPFRARSVFATAALFPAHVRSEREASVDSAVRRGAGFGVLAEKTNESDAILAKHVFVFLSCPDPLGRPGAKGAALEASEGVFRRLRTDCLCPSKGVADNLEGNRNPQGLNDREKLQSAGIALKPSPTETG
jgi:hypothetical protein